MGQFFIVCINLDSKFNLKSLACIYDVQNVVLGTFETLSYIELMANIWSVIFKNSAKIHFHLLLFSFSLNRVGHFVCDSKNWMVIKTTRLLFCADIKKKNRVIPDTSVIPNKRFYRPRLTEAKQHNHCLNSYIMSNKNIPCNSIKQFFHLVVQNYFRSDYVNVHKTRQNCLGQVTSNITFHHLYNFK